MPPTASHCELLGVEQRLSQLAVVLVLGVEDFPMDSDLVALVLEVAASAAGKEVAAGEQHLDRLSLHRPQLLSLLRRMNRQSRQSSSRRKPRGLLA